MSKATAKPPGESCLTCTNRAHSNWRLLSEEELTRLDRSRRVVSRAPGEAIFEQGDPATAVYCVRCGAVTLRHLDSDGNSVTLGLRYPGDLLGQHALLAGGEQRVSAEAIGPTTVCVIDGPAVNDSLARNPELARDMLRRAALELEQAQDSIVRSATLSNRARLITLLLQLLRRHGEPAPDGCFHLHLPLPRRDLASMIGIRHETLSRLIARLESEGLARFSGRKVTVPSLPALTAALRAGNEN
ncbi:MAG: Crp/Fnr family transcriptional regulator [Geminicoccaceae bacterium]